MTAASRRILNNRCYQFIQTNREKPTISIREANGSKEGKEPDYDEDKDQLEEEQEEKTGETTNQIF